MELHKWISNKRIYILLCAICFSMEAFAQNTIYYDYDNSGNRIKRHILYLKSANVSDLDSIPQEQVQKEVATDQLGELTIKIFPNPTRGELTIELSGIGSSVSYNYQLYSFNGQLLKQKSSSKTLFAIDLNNYSAGVYILRLNVEGKYSEWKIIKE